MHGSLSLTGVRSQAHTTHKNTTHVTASDGPDEERSTLYFTMSRLDPTFSSKQFLNSSFSCLINVCSPSSARVLSCLVFRLFVCEAPSEGFDQPL